MKYYYVITENKNGKYYSYAETVEENYNIMALIKRNNNIICVNPCQSRKKAEELSYIWNEGYKENGTYLYN